MKHLMTGLIISILPGILLANTIQPILPESSSLKWIDATFPPGTKLAILSGNPKKKEYYVVRLKLPANYTVPAHSHVTNEYDTVISGTYYMGIGGSIDKKHVITLPTGSFVSFPAGNVHYGFTKKETILQISGIGPSKTIPIKL